MDLNFMIEYINPLILGVCLMVGYVLKVAVKNLPNKYIPLASLILGTAIAIFINNGKDITLELIFGGMISGLASTGLYEMLRNLLYKDGRNNLEIPKTK